MDRLVEPEWLDELAPHDSGAIGSRRDLQRLNGLMGHVRLMERTLRPLVDASQPGRIVELGAGDGDFLLQVARRLGGSWQGTQATLVDRQGLLTSETKQSFRQLGWQVQLRQEDVFDWCRQGNREDGQLVIANLFLHHFRPEPLRELFAAIRRRCRLFVALEPRRSPRSLAFSRLVGLIGCNAVTRHDAPVSVRAGFSGDELSGLWNEPGGWVKREQPAGPFSHLFVAVKAAT